MESSENANNQHPVRRRHHPRVWRESRLSLPVTVRAAGFCANAPDTISLAMPSGMIQLIWMIRGKGQMRKARKTETLTPCCVLLRSALLREGIHVGPGGMEFYWLELDSPNALRAAGAFGVAPGKVYSAGPPPSDQFERLMRVLDIDSLDAEREASVLAQNILLEAARAIERHGQSQGAPPAFVEQCRDLMLDAFTAPETNISQIADELGVDRRELSRRFSQIYGMSPIEYLLYLRIERSLSLLRNTNIPIAEVAQRSGFRSRTYFATAFLKATGVRPSDYRREMRKN